MKMNKKNIFLIFIFIIVYFLACSLIELYKNVRVNDILNEQEKYLEISYKQGLDRFNVIAENIYVSMQNDMKFINLVASVNDKNLDEKHQELYKYLQDEFSKLKLSGIMGLDIIRPNNQTILRMHKVEKYGDYLSDRPMIVQANREKVHLHGFEEGKSIHAFRQIFPLYKNGNFIGILEVLFSSTKLQDYTMRASNIHTHFLVNKHLFHTNIWKSNTQEHYGQSIEHKDFLFSLNDHIHHNILQESARTIIAPLQEEINEGIATGKNFHLYRVVGEKAQILIFYAVKRFVDDKTVAYLVSYTKSEKLYNFLNIIKMIEIGFSLFLAFVYFMVVSLLVEKETLLNELKYDALTHVYNRKYFTNLVKHKYKTLEENEVFSLVMVDIDFFKNVNDTYGHQYGDIVLQEFAKILKESVRSVDIVARYGGEEFIVLLLTDRENAFKVVEIIRQKVESEFFGEKFIQVTASFGLVESHFNSTFIDDLKKADDALYKAKESGRNKVVVA